MCAADAPARARGARPRAAARQYRIRVNITIVIRIKIITVYALPPCQYGMRMGARRAILLWVNFGR